MMSSGRDNQRQSKRHFICRLPIYFFGGGREEFARDGEDEREGKVLKLEGELERELGKRE